MVLGFGVWRFGVSIRIVFCCVVPFGFLLDPFGCRFLSSLLQALFGRAEAKHGTMMHHGQPITVSSNNQKNTLQAEGTADLVGVPSTGLLLRGAF